MKIWAPWALPLSCVSLLLILAGCGPNAPHAPADNPEEVARAKVEAFRRLADVMGKDPNSVAVAGALEEYRNIIAFSAEAFPKQAEEILEIYRQRIQGRYSGEYTQQVQEEVAAIRAGLKAGN